MSNIANISVEIDMAKMPPNDLGSRHPGARISSPEKDLWHDTALNIWEKREDFSKGDALKLIYHLRDSGAYKLYSQFGLSRASVDLLGKMVSMTAANDWQGGNEPMCYASVNSLAFEMDISTRRFNALEQSLIRSGFILDRTYGNNKRRGKRDADGNLILGEGMSLIPLIIRGREIREYLDMLTLLREKHTHLRQEVYKQRAEIRAICRWHQCLWDTHQDNADILGKLEEFPVKQPYNGRIPDKIDSLELLSTELKDTIRMLKKWQNSILNDINCSYQSEENVPLHIHTSNLIIKPVSKEKNSTDFSYKSNNLNNNTEILPDNHSHIDNIRWKECLESLSRREIYFPDHIENIILDEVKTYARIPTAGAYGLYSGLRKATDILVGDKISDATHEKLLDILKNYDGVANRNKYQIAAGIYILMVSILIYKPNKILKPGGWLCGIFSKIEAREEVNLQKSLRSLIYSKNAIKGGNDHAPLQ